jgi:hypothetical protein
LSSCFSSEDTVKSHLLPGSTFQSDQKFYCSLLNFDIACKCISMNSVWTIRSPFYCYRISFFVEYFNLHKFRPLHVYLCKKLERSMGYDNIHCHYIVFVIQMCCHCCKERHMDISFYCERVHLFVFDNKNNRFYCHKHNRRLSV